MIFFTFPNQVQKSWFAIQPAFVSTLRPAVISEPVEIITMYGAFIFFLRLFF